jgi:hypothetical protein
MELGGKAPAAIDDMGDHPVHLLAIIDRIEALVVFLGELAGRFRGLPVPRGQEQPVARVEPSRASCP